MKNIKLQVSYDCPACNGEGKVTYLPPEWEKPPDYPVRTYDKIYCPVCSGAGRLIEWKNLDDLPIKSWREITF
jgi:DnaJ-class molecular chaperone